jgi:hypothetical protein
MVGVRRRGIEDREEGFATAGFYPLDMKVGPLGGSEAAGK